MKRATIAICLLLALAGSSTATDTVLWPERQRAFVEDGPALLMSEVERTRFAELDSAARDRAIDDFLARDPIPETTANELSEGIAARQRLVRRELLSPLDVRAELLFLHGIPTRREQVECGVTFKPLEIWTYGAPPAARHLVVYRPAPRLPFRLWLPLDSKRVLYTSEMEYWLQQFEELRGRIRARRFDLQTCPETPAVDEATGVRGLFGFQPGRPTTADLQEFIGPPADLAEWSRAAVATPLEERAELPVNALDVLFPAREGQRIVTRFLVTLPAGIELGVTEEGDSSEVRLGVDAVLELDGEVFEQFRVLFKLAPPGAEQPIALSLERALRPNRSFVVRLWIKDEVGGGEQYVSRGFAVPPEHEPIAELPVPEDAVVALGEELSGRRIAGKDSLMLVPPETDVVLGLWRAEALVTGDGIARVDFLVDGEKQYSRSKPPFSVEVRLAQYPTEQVVRAEGYGADGELVTADEVMLNQPTGSLRVRVLEPRRGVKPGPSVPARAEVVVPEDRRVERLEFLINDELVQTLERPPWETTVKVPEGEEITYLTVVAVLDDGTRAEDVRFLAAPKYLEQVNVNLIELYTTVSDRNGGLVKGLTVDDFRVKEEGRPQEIVKFELVDDLPLTLGITIDTSGSMVSALPQAQAAARAFLENIITPKDRYFMVSFSDRPVLLMPPTDDVSAIMGTIDELRSVGWTALHDAIVTSLYYFRGVRGRRALILLSDGDDTASSIAFREALEYARRSGVAIYTVGLDVGGLKVAVRSKLKNLAEETGGRSFFIRDAVELATVYDEIEEELRSQYLLAFNSDRPAADGDFRTVEVELTTGRYKARTIRGYYP